MRVIRLELEVDGDVYPELHAALAAVGNDVSRGERLRQLAATGLVWETVRIHGASVALTQGQGPSRASHAEPPRAAGLCVPFGGTNGARTAERGGPMRSHRSDFVDLALNAVPATVPSARDLQEPQLHASDLDIPAADVPLLSDVVDAIPPARAAALQPSTIAAQAVPAPAAAAEGSRPRTADPPFADDISHPADLRRESGNEPMPSVDIVRKAVVRSRLLRMKEMGLFKNG